MLINIMKRNSNSYTLSIHYILNHQKSSLVYSSILVLIIFGMHSSILEVYSQENSTEHNVATFAIDTFSFLVFASYAQYALFIGIHVFILFVVFRYVEKKRQDHGNKKQ